MASTTRITGAKPEKNVEERELEIRNTPSGMKEIKWAGGGEVPKALQGIWNSVHQAKAAIHTYMSTRSR